MEQPRRSLRSARNSSLMKSRSNSLYLHVAELNQAPPESSDSFSLTDVGEKD